MPPVSQQSATDPQLAPPNPGGLIPDTPVAPRPQTPLSPAIEKKPETAKNRTTTQNSLLLSELRENMVIMADGSFRAIIACKSINFDLMSSREREGVEYSYQNFLNALYFPVQIFVRSQRVDIGPYLDRLETQRKSQDNMLLNVLMDDYINFIEVLAQEANIMDKSFFIAIPYYPEGDLSNLVDQGKGILGKILPTKNTTTAKKIDKLTYDKAKDELKNRVDSVMSGLFQIGIKCVQLNTKELGELYYNMYNPDTAIREPLGDFEKITSTYIRKGNSQPATPPTGGS